MFDTHLFGFRTDIFPPHRGDQSFPFFAPVFPPVFHRHSHQESLRSQRFTSITQLLSPSSVTLHIRGVTKATSCHITNIFLRSEGEVDNAAHIFRTIPHNRIFRIFFPALPGMLPHNFGIFSHFSPDSSSRSATVSRFAFFLHSSAEFRIIAFFAYFLSHISAFPPAPLPSVAVPTSHRLGLMFDHTG